MPNWVRNIVEFSGDEKVIAKMREEIRGEGEDRVIDFNKIAPIPKELVGTQAPTLIISQKKYDEQEKRIANSDLTEHEKNWGISRGITQKLADKYRKKFGATDWYEWQNANWGTKWNACDSMEFDNVIEFNTAWSTPFALLLTLSKKYPEVTINVRYADEDFGHNVGEYTLEGGEEVDENIPEGGTYESYIMAMDIQYGLPTDYFEGNEEIFSEYIEDDEEELNDYVSTMIDIAYDHEVYPFEDCEYHELVLERFKEKALADEKFELVAIIQKELDKVEK
jgi:hypothetical protein